jgi:hypothetical protein
MLVLTAAATQVLAGSSQADEKPDFSGTWKAEADQPATSQRPGSTLAGQGSGWGIRFTIRQTSDLLEVERPVFVRYDAQPQPKFRYSLTGDKSTNTVLMGRGAYTEVSTARWEGPRLVITTLRSVDHSGSGANIKYEEQRVLSLDKSKTDSSSPALVIETTRPGVLEGATSRTRTVFHRE